MRRTHKSFVTHGPRRSGTPSPRRGPYVYDRWSDVDRTGGTMGHGWELFRRSERDTRDRTDGVTEVFYSGTPTVTPSKPNHNLFIL